MKGIEILQKKCEELNITLNISPNNNGDVLFIRNDVKLKINVKILSNLYGDLTFFHLEPDEAIDEILKIIFDEMD